MIGNVKSKIKSLGVIQVNTENLMLLNAKTLIQSFDYSQNRSINDFEFKVFSQWGDDGIIQYLINKVDISVDKFVEFGVGNYTECNTRFLLINNNWSGLIMEGSSDDVNQIRQSSIYWKNDLLAENLFITKENINSILKEKGFDGDLGILHIDIDGNDYHIWKTIDCVNADIVIMEYNSLFGSERPITVNYKTDFQRGVAHYSNLFYGSSLRSLCDLAEEKGYAFVGCNMAGNNAYYVKKEKLNGLKVLSCEDGYVKAKFKEGRDENGLMTFMNFEEREREIKGLEVYNTRTMKTESF